MYICQINVPSNVSINRNKNAYKSLLSESSFGWFTVAEASPDFESKIPCQF